MYYPYGYGRPYYGPPPPPGYGASVYVGPRPYYPRGGRVTYRAGCSIF